MLNLQIKLFAGYTSFQQRLLQGTLCMANVKFADKIICFGNMAHTRQAD
jgi:hypothetical protein